MKTAETQLQVGTVSTRSIWLGLAMAGSVVPYFFFETDQWRGIVCAAVTTISLLIMLFCAPNLPVFFTRPTANSLILCCVAGTAIAYGTIRGFYLRNDNYYIAADLFHWLVEMLAIALLTRVALCGPPLTSARVAVFSTAIVITATFVLVVGCYVGIVQYGGYFQGDSIFWHLKAGVNYPQVPFLICCSAVFACRTLSRHVRLFAFLMVVLSMVLLIMTLKRTMWVSTLGMICLCFIPSRTMRHLGVFSVVIAIAVTSALVVGGSDYFDKLNFMTYNDAYTVTDTMEDRTNQLGDAVRLFSLWGHGFGAEINVYDVRTNKSRRIHYLHSLYVYQVLQFGIPLAALCFSIILFLLIRIQALPAQGLTADWRIPAALSCLLGVSLNGVTLVSSHSAFFGMAIGLSVAAINEFRVDGNGPLTSHPTDPFPV